ncbi:MAG: type II toxin-antitoxin system VapC family toxin [Anaerolineae bacterium]|nr:type II toxin-antitoxin system VapC family toxin [Anaerolineae bacterium]
MIIDASVILAAFFPDEQQAEAQAVIGDYAAGRIALVAPSLLVYEVTNAIWQATRRGRITNEQAEAIMQAFEGIAILLEPVAWQPMMSLARQFGRSAYDAAYLALAQEKREPLVTGDLRLYNAVAPHLPWVQWIGDYRT